MLPPNNTAAVCNFGSKFGASLRESEQLLTEAKQLGLHIVGVSFPVGSGCFTLTAYEDALKQARHLFDMGLQHGFKMRLLDIGGGFPGDDDGALTFTQIANCIGPMLDQLFPKDVGRQRGGQRQRRVLVARPLTLAGPRLFPSIGGGVRVRTHRQVEVVAEPGRYFASACMTLAANVVSRRERIVTTVNEAGQEVDTDERSFLYYISDGVYGSFNCIVRDLAPRRRLGCARHAACGVSLTSRPLPVRFRPGPARRSSSTTQCRSRLSSSVPSSPRPPRSTARPCSARRATRSTWCGHAPSPPGPGGNGG